MRRRLALILGVALVVVASIGVGGAAQALWVANAPVSTSATAGSVGLKITGLDQVSDQFSSSTTSFGPMAVTLSNTGTLPLSNIATALSQNGTTALAGKVKLAIWDNGTKTTCPATAPSGTTTSTTTWADAINWPGLTSLAVGASKIYCLTSSMTTTDIAVGGQSVATTVTISVSDGWSTSAAATINFSTPTSPTNVSGSQIGISSGSSSTSVGTITLPNYGGNDDANEHSDGTLITPTYVCVYVKVSTSTATWRVAVNMSAPPFNGTALTNPALSMNGVQTGTLDTTVAEPDGNGVYYVVGPSSQDHFSFCVTVSNKPADTNPGPDTYSVTGPKVGSCSDQTKLPTSSTDVCAYATVTGNHPHFEIGYHFATDLDALAATPGLTAAEQAKITAAAGTLTPTMTVPWGFFSAVGGASVGQPPTIQVSGHVLTYYSTGVEASSGGIAIGQSITLIWRFQ